MATARRRRRSDVADSSPFVVITGLSGAGKSHAIRALEDLGFFCVDNLPVSLIPTLAQLTLRAGAEFSRAAVVVDVRERSMLRGFPEMWRQLKRVRGLAPALIYLDASERALVRRFSETRRPHPLAANGSVLGGIREERRRLAPIKRLADRVVVTSDLTVHELRQAFLELSRGAAGQPGPVVTLLSFGFKHGLPVDADLVFDVRFLPNPHFVPALRAHTGRDRRVRAYLDKARETREFLERTAGLLQFLLPQYAGEGKSYVTVAVGCTGGRHRSVAVVEALRQRLAGLAGVRLRVRHRDIAAD